MRAIARFVVQLPGGGYHGAGNGAPAPLSGARLLTRDAADVLAEVRGGVVRRSTPRVRVRSEDRDRVPRWMMLAVVARDGLTCQICKCAVDPKKVHFDHVTPVHEGGGDEVDNLRVACAPCNLRRERPSKRGPR